MSQEPHKIHEYMQLMEDKLFAKEFPSPIDDLKKLFVRVKRKLKLQKKELKEFRNHGKKLLQASEIALVEGSYKKCLKNARQAALLLPSNPRPKEIMVLVYSEDSKICPPNTRRYADFLLLLEPDHELASKICVNKKSLKSILTKYLFTQ